MTAPTTPDGQPPRSAFRRMHDSGVLVLPNAWDVASAMLVEQAGAAAVATTSAGVAWSLGSPDGDRLARHAAVALVARVSAAVGVPVTADIESGYGADLDELAGTVGLVVSAGAAGINIEDSVTVGSGRTLREPTEQADRLRAVRAAADARGSDLFVNARVDTFLLGAGRPDRRLADTVDRAQAYLAAGADGVFVPGVAAPEPISRLVAEVPAPLNVMVGPGSPTVAELAALGVRRVSAGPALAQAAYALVRDAAAELLGSGTYRRLADAAPTSFVELDGLLSRAR